MTKRHVLLKLQERAYAALRHSEEVGVRKTVDRMIGWIEGVLDEMKGKGGK